MRRALVLLPLFALLLSLTACGGGGGGDDDAPDGGAPGTLRALAIEGDPAPDVGAGVFAAFPTFPIMSVAEGGWCAFVAQVTGGSAAEVVYTALPDGSGTIVRTFAQGDAVQGTARFILDFAGVWMCADGTVIALVNLTGGTGTQDFALIAVDLDTAGTATNLRTLLVDEADISSIVSGGVLSDIDVMTLIKTQGETLWMLITDATGGGVHLVSIESDGTGFTKRASPGDSLSGDVVATVDAFGVDAAGGFFAFVVTDGGGARRLILREAATSPSVNVQVQRDADPLPSGNGTVADAWKGGRIGVYGNATVVWVCKGTISGADDIYMLYQNNAATQYTEMARVTETAPDTGMGTFSAINTLNAAPSAQRVLFQAAVGGGTFGVNNATFRVDGVNPVTVRIDTGDLVASGGQVISAAYVNLRQQNRPYDEVAFNGDFVYAQTWNAGANSAVWYMVRNGPTNLLNAIAANGSPAPGTGDVFGSFASGVGMTIANGVVAFRGPLDMGGTGIFRQGP